MIVNHGGHIDGDTVDKVGARTGWVTAIYIDRSTSSGGTTHWFICVHEVNAGMGPGDSGSGVYVYSAGDVTFSWAGQAFAGRTAGVNGFFTYYLFAPTNNIQAECGSIIATIYGW